MLALRSVGGVLLAGGLAGLCGAQENGLYFAFPTGNVYDGTNPVKVEIWTGFEPQHYAFAGWAGQLNANDPTGKWNNLSLPLNAGIPGPAPMSGGGNVTNIITGQLHFPPVLLAKTDNPILIFTGEWSSPDLSARTVGLMTVTTKYSLYLDSSGVSANSTPVEGAGEIKVVPSAGGVGLVAACGLMAMRRTGRAVTERRWPA